MQIIHISIPSLFIETTVKLHEVYYFIWGDIASDNYPPFEREIVSWRQNISLIKEILHKTMYQFSRAKEIMQLKGVCIEMYMHCWLRAWIDYIYDLIYQQEQK